MVVHVKAQISVVSFSILETELEAQINPIYDDGIPCAMVKIITTDKEQINGIDCVGFGNFDGHIVYLPYGSYWSNEFYKANVVEAGTLGPYFRSYSSYNDTPLRIRVCPDN